VTSSLYYSGSSPEQTTPVSPVVLARAAWEARSPAAAAPLSRSLPPRGCLSGAARGEGSGVASPLLSG
jgi:hypothetical protein